MSAVRWIDISDFLHSHWWKQSVFCSPPDKLVSFISSSMKEQNCPFMDPDRAGPKQNIEHFSVKDFPGRQTRTNNVPPEEEQNPSKKERECRVMYWSLRGSCVQSDGKLLPKSDFSIYTNWCAPQNLPYPFPQWSETIGLATANGPRLLGTRESFSGKPMVVV